MHWAVHRHTAAELIVERAKAEKENMGLTTCEDLPERKENVLFGKNRFTVS